MRYDGIVFHIAEDFSVSVHIPGQSGNLQLPRLPENKKIPKKWLFWSKKF